MRAHIGAFDRHQAIVTTSAAKLGLSSSSTSTPLSLFAQALAFEVDERMEADRQKWAGSTYEQVRYLWNQSKGTTVGESLARHILQTAGLEVESAFKMVQGGKSAERGYDLFAPGLNRVEVKLSTEGVTEKFAWSNLSPTKADNFLLLGVTPNLIHGWLLPAERINRLFGMKLTGKDIRGISRNHDDSFGINVSTAKPPAWIKPFGGTEAALLNRIGVESRRR